VCRVAAYMRNLGQCGFIPIIGVYEWQCLEVGRTALAGVAGSVGVSFACDSLGGDVTFRQILNILWQRRLIIIATVVLAFVVAAGFLKLQTPSYESTTTVRLSAVGTAAANTGQIGSTPVDFAIESLTLPAVLSEAAKHSGDASGAALEGKIEFAVVTGTLTNTITVTAVGPTPESAQARATAVVNAYNAYLQGQLNKAVTAAQAQAVKYTAAAEQYQGQVTQSPLNALAQSNLANAIRNLGTANAEIDKITSSGAPLTVLIPAPPGSRQGVSPAAALLIALVAGLIAGIAVALIRDQFDNRLRGEQEIAELTGALSLGELSLDRRVARHKQRLPAAERKHTALNEGLRALRVTMQVLLPASRGLVVFTSVEPGDGKTFVSANLALVWARMGKRVILVGGDLRRPRLGEYYGEAADGAGLAELLTSASVSGAPTDAEVHSYLRPSGFEGLLLLPSGAEPPAPADLLANEALESIFDSLRAISDIVIVDSPPSMAIVDATLLASSADGAVLVASIGRTNREHLTETVRALNSSGVTVLGTIANRSRRRVPSSYAGYYGTHDIRNPGHQTNSHEETAADAGAPVPDENPVEEPTLEPALEPTDSDQTTRSEHEDSVAVVTAVVRPGKRTGEASTA
jgi:succinoglycan biosynthesis transport protein ExoP